MRSKDDEIKIFHPKIKETPASDLTSIAGVMDKHRANGNSAKADILGERLADYKPEDLCPDDVKKISNKELMQLRALMVFAAQIAMHKYLPHKILSAQAVTSMYAKIEQTSPGFFSNISDGSSYSFYYLDVRHNDDAAELIGTDYATHCRRDE